MSWLIALWAAPTAAGFGVAFGVPWRWLPMVAGLGALGRLVRTGGEAAGEPLALASLAAAAVIAFGALLVTRRGGRDAAMLAVPAVIPLLPGTLLYRCALAFAASGQGPEQVAQAVALGVQAIGVLLGLVVGLTLPQLIAGPPRGLRRH